MPIETAWFRWGRRLVPPGIVTALLLIAAPASAHAIVRSVEPGIDEVVASPPARVVMRFNEPVEIEFGALRVFDSTGRRVDADEADHVPGRADAVQVPLERGLAQGTYTVSWRIIAADGHPIEEAFVFHVGRPGAKPEGLVGQVVSGEAGAGALEGFLFGVARWLNFAAMLVMAGVAAFLILVWRRALAVRPSEVEDAFAARWGRVLAWTWWVTLGATVASYVLQGAVAGDLPITQAVAPSVLGEVAGTRFGLVLIAKLVLLGGVAAVWRLVRARLRSERRPPVLASVGAAAAIRPLPVPLVAAGGVLLAGVLLTPGLSGHAGTTQPVALNLLADGLHMVAAALWLGGLVSLIVLAFPATRTLDQRDRVAVLGPVVSRFSDLAVVAVGALVVSGSYRAWTEIRALRGLTGAAYGLVFLGKMAAFLPLIGLGAINNRWTKPRIDRAVKENRPQAAPLTVLRRLVGVEVMVATVVLALTAFLVTLPPSRVAAGISGPFVQDVRIGDHNLEIMVDPNRVGENVVHLRARSAQGMPADFEGMRALFRMPEEEIGPLPAEAMKHGHGRWRVEGLHLSVPGEWELELVAKVDRFTEVRTRVTFTVNR